MYEDIAADLLTKKLPTFELSNILRSIKQEGQKEKVQDK
jgi:hypothetical protein